MMELCGGNAAGARIRRHKQARLLTVIRQAPRPRRRRPRFWGGFERPWRSATSFPAGRDFAATSGYLRDTLLCISEGLYSNSHESRVDFVVSVGRPCPLPPVSPLSVSGNGAKHAVGRDVRHPGAIGMFARHTQTMLLVHLRHNG